MVLVKAQRMLEKELAWMKSEVAKGEAVLALMRNGHRQTSGKRKYKMSEETRRKISLGRRKQLAATRK